MCSSGARYELGLRCCRGLHAVRLDRALRRAPCVFFFQAEDGIRDKLVTGVQTCALPIMRRESAAGKSEMSGALIEVDIRDVLGESKKAPLIAFYAAGTGVMFLLFSASGAGGTLLEESESGTLDRLLSTRVTMTTLLLGKLLFLTIVGVVQLTVMFLWGAAVFGLELFSHLGGFFTVTIA